MQDVTEEAASPVIIVVGLKDRLKLRKGGPRRLRPFSLVGRPMMVMMHRGRKDVDHEVNGQRGETNPGAVQEHSHVTDSQARVLMSSSPKP